MPYRYQISSPRSLIEQRKSRGRKVLDEDTLTPTRAPLISFLSPLHTVWICMFLFQAAFGLMQKNAVRTKCFEMSFISNTCTFTPQTATTQF